MQCGGCAKSSDRINMLCANCAGSTVQQKRTILMALWADVAVLREKSAHALESKDLSSYQIDIQALEDQQQERERCQIALDRERIALAKLKHHIAERQAQLLVAKTRLHGQSTAAGEADDGVDYIMEGLGRVLRWNEQNLTAMRRTKVLQLFQLFQLFPAPRLRYFRTIVKLPVPSSGQYEATEHLPPEVVSAALGRMIHLLILLPKYLSPLVYPHPMIFNGSFSTIGEQSGEGAGCHTLYPDGSMGFARGVAMLWQNVAYLCIAQGMMLDELDPVDSLGNLIRLAECPTLGSCAPHKPSTERLHEMMAESSAAMGGHPLVAMASSLRILPEYNPNDMPDHDGGPSPVGLSEWNVVEARPSFRQMQYAPP
ncbi:hypothetical protein H310_06370 [Aphanomyces invadans]|uniref:Uncharacterized protein n=1 Tax=Aphanomyces invadans TaxID=157072 RepID=A0A024U6E1_9STRA|nr:hypothetical protein H310_06370 [Aphanomyces invadans]ETW01790.1 hypothetical protein H310_06370 [Aphanomyces invadans]|eukprot:XP_008869638.1 hypothetical protein H310_06370 [Aphanomyces invadans]